MNREPSHAVQTVRLRSLKPNPTPASPYLSGNRCQNWWPKATGNVARAAQRCAVAKRPGSDTPGGVVSASRVVRASTTRAKHGTAALGGLPKWLIRLTASSYLGVWRCHLEKMALYFVPVTVPLRLCTRRVSPAYKVYPKWPGDAMVKRTLPKRPLLQGFQQRRSSHL